MQATYRDILRSELKSRIQRNPQYSLRAFAKAIGLKAPHLSAVLSGTKGLSADSAARIAQALGWSKAESQEFVELVTAVHARKKSARLNAQDLVAKKSDANAYKLLDIENFKLVSDWQHFAILHLMELKDFKPDPKWIARRLGLKSETVKESLKRLAELELIDTTNSGWKPKQKFFRTPNVTSAAIRNSHHQYLRLAGDALENRPLAERDFSTVVMALKKDSVAEAKEWIQEFRRKFCEKLDSAEEKDALYALSTQFFELTQNPQHP